MSSTHTGAWCGAKGAGVGDVWNHAWIYRVLAWGLRAPTHGTTGGHRIKITLCVYRRVFLVSYSASFCWCTGVSFGCPLCNASRMLRALSLSLDSKASFAFFRSSICLVLCSIFLLIFFFACSILPFWIRAISFWCFFCCPSRLATTVTGNNKAEATMAQTIFVFIFLNVKNSLSV